MRKKEDTQVELRAEAEAQGLINPLVGPEDPQFFFNLAPPNIPFTLLQDPQKVLRLVELARSHAKSEGMGDHHLLLSLTTERSGLRLAFVMWDHPSHNEPERDPKDWITLGDWLREQGFEYVPRTETRGPMLQNLPEIGMAVLVSPDGEVLSVMSSAAGGQMLRSILTRY